MKLHTKHASYLFKREHIVKIVLTTTRIKRPPIFNDQFETHPPIFTIICH